MYGAGLLSSSGYFSDSPRETQTFCFADVDVKPTVGLDGNRHKNHKHDANHKSLATGSLPGLNRDSEGLLEGPIRGLLGLISVPRRWSPARQLRDFRIAGGAGLFRSGVGSTVVVTTSKAI